MKLEPAQAGMLDPMVEKTMVLTTKRKKS